MYKNKSIPIRLWAEDDRPMDKILLKGKQALSDAELLSVILRTGSSKIDALELAKDILRQCDFDLYKLSKMDYHSLIKIEGIGKTKALSIISSFELSRRLKSAEIKDLKKIFSSKDIYDLMYEKMYGLKIEVFWIILLNRANRVICTKQISSGGISGTTADPKVIFKMALDHSATSVVLSHNHPSGNIKPSDSDIRLTKKLKEAGEMLDLVMLDHVIFTDDKYYSFADEGVI